MMPRRLSLPRTTSSVIEQLKSHSIAQGQVPAWCFDCSSRPQYTIALTTQQLGKLPCSSTRYTTLQFNCSCIMCSCRSGKRRVLACGLVTCMRSAPCVLCTGFFGLRLASCVLGCNLVCFLSAAPCVWMQASSGWHMIPKCIFPHAILQYHSGVILSNLTKAWRN